MAKHGSTSTSLIVGTMDGAGSRAVFTPFQTVPLTSSYSLYTVNFADYVGTDEYIAFKLETGASNAYRYIYIDDVVIEVPAPIAPEPANLVWPLNGITTLLNPLLTWTPSATGEPVTSYKVYMNDSGTFSESDMIYEGTDTQFQTADMGYERTYYWKVLPINANGSDPTCPTWSFSTPGEYQLAEGFENTVPPAGWSSVGTAWSRGSSYKVEGSYSAYKAGSTSSQYILTTPLLTIVEGSSLQFGALGTSTSASLQIVYSEDGTTWTQIGDTITHTDTYTFTPQVIDLSDLAGNNYYLGFRT
ncbi:MAG: choice-of-anchor J domain-containing protein, partial [Candidatus Cloacimonetes bacterium]|nr:choice-of-anchor J domain-containing protein [Candidatus Cloacimonadota bacterium]